MKWYYWLVVAAVLVIVLTVTLMMGMSTQNVEFKIQYETRAFSNEFFPYLRSEILNH